MGFEKSGVGKGTPDHMDCPNKAVRRATCTQADTAGREGTNRSSIGYRQAGKGCNSRCQSRRALRWTGLEEAWCRDIARGSRTRKKARCKSAHPTTGGVNRSRFDLGQGGGIGSCRGGFEPGSASSADQFCSHCWAHRIARYSHLREFTWMRLLAVGVRGRVDQGSSRG